MATGSAPADPTGPWNGLYTGYLTFEQWRKLKGNNNTRPASRDEFESWSGYNTEQIANQPLNQGVTLKKTVEEEPEREDVGSTPGFEKVQRFLRQQRATGRVVSLEETRLAWQGYWDAWTGKQTERERIGIEADRLDLQKEQFAWQRKFAEKGRDIDEKSAASAGGSMIGMGLGFAVGGPAGAVVGGMIGGMIGGSK